MSILRKANDERKTISLDETDYIVVRADISKREFNALAEAMPKSATEEGGSLSMTEASIFQRALFGVLVVGWSLDEDPSVEAYDGLSAAGASAIDIALAKHFETLLPSSAEGK